MTVTEYARWERYHCQLSSRRFNKNVTLHMDDNSFIHFRYAFTKRVGKGRDKEILVFTEHNGWHRFLALSVVLVEEG